MVRVSWYNKDGTLKLAKKGKPQKVKKRIQSSKNIDVCLNCTKAKCKGACFKLRKGVNNSETISTSGTSAEGDERLESGGVLP